MKDAEARYWMTDIYNGHPSYDKAVMLIWTENPYSEFSDQLDFIVVKWHCHLYSPEQVAENLHRWTMGVGDEDWQVCRLRPSTIPSVVSDLHLAHFMASVWLSPRAKAIPLRPTAMVDDLAFRSLSVSLFRVWRWCHGQRRGAERRVAGSLTIRAGCGTFAGIKTRLRAS